MRLTMTCEHGTREAEFEMDVEVRPDLLRLRVNELQPMCPYCDIVERPKAKVHAKPWCPSVTVEAVSHE